MIFCSKIKRKWWKQSHYKFNNKYWYNRKKNKLKDIEELEQDSDGFGPIYLHHEVNENGNVEKGEEYYLLYHHTTNLVHDVLPLSKIQETLKNRKEKDNHIFHLHNNILANIEKNHNHIELSLVLKIN